MLTGILQRNPQSDAVPGLRLLAWALFRPRAGTVVAMAIQPAARARYGENVFFDMALIDMASILDHFSSGSENRAGGEASRLRRSAGRGQGPRGRQTDVGVPSMDGEYR